MRTVEWNTTGPKPETHRSVAELDQEYIEKMEDVLATPDPAGEFYGTYHPRNPKPGEPMTAN